MRSTSLLAAELMSPCEETSGKRAELDTAVLSLRSQFLMRSGSSADLLAGRVHEHASVVGFSGGRHIRS